MKRTLSISVLLMMCVGCQRELSVVHGVSVRPAEYQGWGQSPGLDELRLWGHTLSDLGARSVSPEALMPEDRVISFVDSSDRYDVSITANWQARGELCREMLRQTFGVCATRSSREIDVLVLVPIGGGPVALEATKVPKEPGVKTWPIEICRWGLAALLPRARHRITHTFTSCDMETLAAWLEGGSDKVVLDETKLPGAFDFQLIDDSRNGITIQTSLASLGLELRPARRTVSAVFVDTTGLAASVRVARSDRYSKSARPWWAMRPRATQE